MICFFPAASLRQDFQKQIFKDCKPGFVAMRDIPEINYNSLLINVFKSTNFKQA